MIDLFEFYRIGDSIKQCLIETAKLRRQQNLPKEYDFLYENIWWKLRFVLDDYINFTKKLESMNASEVETN